MNLRQIEAFKAVMEAGTVTQAAARLNISQPAVSKLLQMFERGAGMPLFIRDRGRLSPTVEARLLYEEVERVFQGADRVRQAAAEIKSLRRGTLSVGAMPALSVGFAQEILARLQESHPGIQMILHARETPHLIEQLVMHQIELLYSAHPLDHPELRVESLCCVPFVCILPHGHRLASKAEISCSDLRGERFASFRHGTPLRRHIDQAFEDAKVSRINALEAPMATPICAFVARGLGVSVVNPLFVGAFAPTLVIRPFAPRITQDVFMATPRSRRISRLAEAFAQASRDFGALVEADPDIITLSYGRSKN
jgi:DNA-binding transcriptional LysR family regulator